MFLRNKLAILSFTLMSLMTIPTLAENDTPPVTSRIEDAIHTVEIKTPAGWQETKDFSEIPESFEFNGLTFQGIKFKNGTVKHGCAIFFATDLDEDEFSEEDLVKAHAQIQEMAFPGLDIQRLTVTKFHIGGIVEADIQNESIKARASGNFEAKLSKQSGNPSTLKVSGVIEQADSKNNFAQGIGRFVLEDTQTLSGATGLLLTDTYQLCLVSWGADEAILEKDLNLFVESIAVISKAPHAKGAAEPAIVKEQAPAEPVAKVEEPKPVETPVAAAEEVKVAAPAEPIAAAEEPKPVVTPIAATEEAKIETPAEPVATVEEPKPVETPVAAAEEVKVAAPAEPVAAAEEPKPVETPVAATEEVKVAAPAEPIAVTEEPKPVETAVAVTEEAKVAAPAEPIAAVQEPKEEAIPAVTETAKQAHVPVEVIQAGVEAVQPNV
jgi:hypothetical protein